MSNERKYVAYWDSLGFECIVDITTYERQRLLADISGKDNPTPPVNMHALLMRARFNPQRSPEIWGFTSTVDRETLLQISEESPQALVDEIRRVGVNYWKQTPAQEPVIK